MTVCVAVADLLGLSAAAVAAVGLASAALAGAVIRHTLGALVAGAGIRVARPYSPGERLRLHVPSLGEVVEAEVVRVGPANTTLMTSGGLVVVPNNRMLRTGPGAGG